MAKQGLPPSEWLEFTMDELDGVLSQTKEMRKNDDYNEWHRFAFLASVVVNVNKGKKGRSAKPQDFIGVPPWEKKKKAVIIGEQVI